MAMKQHYDGTMLDITAPKREVSVDASANGSVLWVNVDGACVLRICRIPNLYVLTRPINQHRCSHEWIPITSRVHKYAHICTKCKARGTIAVEEAVE